MQRAGQPPGLERALDPSTIRPVSDDGGIRTAEGHELTAVKQGDMPLRVCGVGEFKGDDRVICIKGVQLYSELPSYRRVVSPGRLEAENPDVKVDTLNSCVHLYRDGHLEYSFAIVKDHV